MRERKAEFDRLGTAILAISFEPASAAARFMAQEGIPFPVLSDPSRRAYAAFGLQHGRLSQVWNWPTAKAYLRELLHGRWPHQPHGDVMQLGGDFVLDAAGRIAYAHRSQNPADRPSVAELLTAVKHAIAVSKPER